MKGNQKRLVVSLSIISLLIGNSQAQQMPNITEVHEKLTNAFKPIAKELEPYKVGSFNHERGVPHLHIDYSKSILSVSYLDQCRLRKDEGRSSVQA